MLVERRKIADEVCSNGALYCFKQHVCSKGFPKHVSLLHFSCLCPNYGYADGFPSPPPPPHKWPY